LSEAGSDIHIQAQSIHVAGPESAGAARVDRHDDLQVLVCGEIATHQSSAACGCFPIDGAQRIAPAVFAELQHFRS
jgi:hypothetical protein